MQTIKAIYTEGVLKPVTPLKDVAENAEVTLTVESQPHTTPRGPLEGWVGGVSNEDTAELLRVVEEEFEKVDPNEWK